MMYRIYSQPLTVIVYVGHESKEQDSYMAMQLLSDPDKLGSDSLDEYQRSSIQYLVRRPYFQRMWIVQECALATSLRLICGKDEVYISKFAKTSLEKVVAANNEAIPAWLKHSRQMPEVVGQEGSSQAKKLLDLMFDTASCQCTDARDRIFALFSLLGTGAHGKATSDQRLVADYDLTLEQVYIGIAAFFVDNGFLGTILELAELTRRKTRTTSSSAVKYLPSWVPDWSRINASMRRDLQSHIEDNIVGDIYSRRRYVFEPHVSALYSDQPFP